MPNEDPYWTEIYEKLSPLCTRKDVSKACKLIAVQTLANHDSKNTGIEGRLVVGSRVVYPRENVIDWLKNWKNSNCKKQ